MCIRDSAMGAVTNTTLAMGMLYIVYAKDIVMAAGKSFKVILLGILTSSAIIEAIIMGVAAFAIMQIYVKKKSKIAAEV